MIKKLLLGFVLLALTGCAPFRPRRVGVATPGQIDLTHQVSGILPQANGGMGACASAAYFYNQWDGSVWACQQVGFHLREVSGSSDSGVVASDTGGQIDFTGSAAATESLPTPTTLGNPNFAFALWNRTTGAATTVTVTPSSWLIGGNSTLVIEQQQYCWIYPNAAGTAWVPMCHFTGSAEGTVYSADNPPSGGGQVKMLTPVTVNSGDTATLYTFPGLSAGLQYFVSCRFYLNESTTSEVPRLGITLPAGGNTLVGLFWSVLTGTPPVATQAGVCAGGGFFCGGTYPTANFNYGPNELGGTFTPISGGTFTITGGSSGGGSTTFSPAYACKVFH
jgi:hypothetical protein